MQGDREHVLPVRFERRIGNPRFVAAKVGIKLFGQGNERLRCDRQLLDDTPSRTSLDLIALAAPSRNKFPQAILIA